MEKPVRVQRVEKEILHLIASYLQHEVIESLPVMASVTAVDVAKDLRKAAVYFRLIGEKTDASETEDILETHRKLMQNKIAKSLPMKFCPVLRFHFGVVQEESEIDRLLAQLHQRKD